MKSILLRRFFLASAVSTLAVLLPGCAVTSQSDLYRANDPQTIKVIDGEVLDFKLITNKEELSLYDSGSAAIAANNVGNSTVQGALLAVDLVSGALKLADGNRKPFYIEVKEYKTSEIHKLISKEFIAPPDRYKKGDRVIIVMRSKYDFQNYKVTEANAKTTEEYVFGKKNNTD